MNTINKYFLFFLSLFFVISCKEKETTFLNLPKEGRYFTEHIWITPSVDLNRDGRKSDDLMSEIHWIQHYTDFNLNIENREQQGYRYLYFGYPYLYTDPNDPIFLNAGAKGMNTRFESNGSSLKMDNPNILSAILLNDSTIEVTSVAEFELIEGNKEVEMKAVYTLNSL